MREPVTTDADRFLALLKPIERDLEMYARRLVWEPQDAPDALQNAVMCAFAAFDRDKPALSTHDPNVRASRSGARLLVAPASAPAGRVTVARAAQAWDGVIPLSAFTTSVMASSCERRCFWISIASCKTASASL